MTPQTSHVLPYRKCVGALLFNAEGKVFVAKRIDHNPPAWQMPQGGVDKKEKTKAAVLRELEEEIGTDKFEILAKAKSWLAYDLPEDLVDTAFKGKYRGQRQRWFALRFTGSDADVDLRASGHPEFDDWYWAEIATLPSLAVPFKRTVYEALVDEFTPLAQEISKTR